LYDKHIAYFRQSRAKKKEIIADSKIAKVNSLKRIPFGSFCAARYLPNVGRVGLSGGAAGNGAVTNVVSW
jgi:hypothetical protein